MKRSRSNAAGKRPIVQNITINKINKINKTINNYFANAIKITNTVLY